MTGCAAEYYAQRTGLNLDSLAETLDSLRSRKLMVDDATRLACTEQGHVFFKLSVGRIYLSFIKPCLCELPSWL